MNKIHSVIFFSHIIFNIGFGLGLPMIAKILVLAEYFEENFSTVNSIGFAGGVMGMIILAPAVECLISQFGWKGALIISSAFSFNICVAGQVMIHPPQKSKNHYTLLNTNDNDRSETDIEAKRNPIDWKTYLKRLKHNDHDRKTCLGFGTRKTGIAFDDRNTRLGLQKFSKYCWVVKDVDIAALCDSKDLSLFCNTMCEQLGFTILAREPELSLYMVAFTLQEVTLSGWILFLFTYTISLGYDKQIATFLSSAGGFGILIGRLFQGPFADKGLCSHRLQIGIFALGGCTCLSLYPFTLVYWHLVLLSLMTGLFVGTTTPIYVSLSKEMFPDSSLDFSGSVSLHYTMIGIGMFCGGPLTGKRKK